MPSDIRWVTPTLWQPPQFPGFLSGSFPRPKRLYRLGNRWLSVRPIDQETTPRCISSSQWTKASTAAGYDLGSTRALKFRQPSNALLLGSTPPPNPVLSWFLDSALGPPHESGNQPGIPSEAHHLSRPKNAPVPGPEGRCPIDPRELLEAPTAAGLLNHPFQPKHAEPIPDRPPPPVSTRPHLG